MSIVIGSAFGVTLVATMTLKSMMLQRLMHSSAIDTGLVLMPRGVGTMFAIAIVDRIVTRRERGSSC